MVSRAPCNEMMPRNIQAVYEDDIIARRFLPPALAGSTPFNRAISCELKSPLMSKEALKHLKVLSIEKNLAVSGVIPKTFIKGRGAEIFSKIRSILHPIELSYKNMPRTGIDPGTFRSSV